MSRDARAILIAFILERKLPRNIPHLWKSCQVTFASGSQAGLGPPAPPLGNKSVILRMRSNPVPHDFVAFQDSDRSIAGADTNRVDWPCRMDRLETKTRMIRVLLEKLVGSAGLTLNLWRQFCECFSELRSGM